MMSIISMFFQDGLTGCLGRLGAVHGVGIPVMRTPQQILFLILQLARPPVPVHQSEALRCAEQPRCDLQVPGNGWAQIVAVAGYCELVAYKYTGEPGAYGAGFPESVRGGPQEEAQL